MSVEASEVAALLQEFAAAQREHALTQTKRQRIMVQRTIGDMQVSFESLVDEGASPQEIFAVLEPLDGALDRMQAKAFLSAQYNSILNKCGKIEAAAKDLQTHRVSYETANALRNTNRRVERVGLTVEQDKALKVIRDDIVKLWQDIAEGEKAAAETLRIFEGEDPFVVQRDQMRARIDELRVTRQDAA